MYGAKSFVLNLVTLLVFFMKITNMIESLVPFLFFIFIFINFPHIVTIDYFLNDKILLSSLKFALLSFFVPKI